MLSVLIPTYNYNVISLVTELHRQLTKESVVFEILCLDDGSKLDVLETNRNIEAFSNTSLLVSNTTNGSLKSRVLLSEKSKYKWLLFIDADTLPKSDTYILNYLKAIDFNKNVFFGGFAYYNNPPENDYMLRWKYGRTHEQVPAKKRNKNPYKLIISSNFLIKKEAFQKLNLHIENSSYGFDNYFSAQLKQNKISIMHLDNEVYHLGIEPSSVYLKKKEQAAESLLFLSNSNLMKDHDVSLLNLFITLKKVKLNFLISKLYRMLNKTMRKNLTSSNPSIKILQLYRIGYLCSIDLNNKTKYAISKTN
jgi:hypothetical protein